MIVLALVAAACAKPPVASAPRPAAAFAGAIEVARQRVDSGDYAAADRVLADFAFAHPGTVEAREIAFWRALYIVDPANKSGSTAQGIKALEAYLANLGSIWYRPQAEVLRREALVIQQVKLAQLPKLINGRDSVSVSREEELVALRDQLAKATAELERIKKRLANPGR
jgi:hypothetical protein